MIAEVGKTAVEVGKVVAEASEKVAESAAKAEKVAEAGGKSLKGSSSIDIGKRIDVTKPLTESKTSGIDISKRIVPEIESRGKDLTSKQVKDLTSRGMSPGIVNDCKFKDGVFNLKTNNEKFEGMKEPQTGVPYEKKVVDLFGMKVEGVFPKFESTFTAQLPKEKLIATDKVQFSECISQLQQGIKDNPSLKSKFSARQLEQIADGRTPGGFTWNHNEEVGKMELVDTEKHSIAKHTGGKAVWGGGSAMRS